MPSLAAMVGSYIGVESLRLAAHIDDTTRDAIILEHLLAASRAIEQETDRRFFPYTGASAYRWPPVSNAFDPYSLPPYVSGADLARWTSLPNSALWTLPLADDLLSVTSVQTAASGIGAVPVALTHFFLEPQRTGPPFNRFEIDLSSSDIFQAGPTPQESVILTGVWGYCNTVRPAGTLAAAITSTTATTLTCSDASRIDQGDVLLIDSEAIYVDNPRTGATLTVQRGVNGTTAATHLNAAPISKYLAPADVRRVVRADAVGTFMQDQAAWGRTIGAGDMAVELQGKAIKTMRQEVIEHYRRVKVVFA